MKKAMCVTGKVVRTTGKILAIGLLFIGHIVMSGIGILICAITN